MDLEYLAEHGLDLGKKLEADEIEIYVVRSTSCEARSLSSRRIETIFGGSRIDIGVRIVVDKRVAVGGGSISGVEDLESIVRKVFEIAKHTPRDDKWRSLPTKLGFTLFDKAYDPKLAKNDPTVLLDMLDTMTSTVEKHRDINVVRAVARSYIIERMIANSYGRTNIDKHTAIEVFLAVRVSGEESGFYDTFEAKTLERFNPEAFAENCCRLAKLTAHCRAVPTERLNVVLINKVFASIASTLLVPALAAHNVQRERSPLRGKLGEQVLSEDLSIVDDGAAPNLINSKSFDDEGIATQRKVVFDRGVLQTYLYDHYTSTIENRESTGNAVRRAVHEAPQPWSTNFIILPGSEDLEKLVKTIGRGLVVYRTIGEWLSNPINGLLNATISNAVYVENGEVKHGVKGVIICGNIYELLKDKVMALGNDVDGVEGCYAPSIALRDVTIAKP